MPGSRVQFLHRLNARRSDNFIEFVRNAFFQPPESILSSLRIAKRLGKRGWLCSWVVLLALAYRVKSPRVGHWKILSVEPLCVTGTVLHRLNAVQSETFIEFQRNALLQPPESILSSLRIAKRLGKRGWLCSWVVLLALAYRVKSPRVRHWKILSLEPVTHGHGFAASSTIQKNLEWSLCDSRERFYTA